MLYHWNQVEYNQGYAPGNIIVDADTVQEARDAAEAHARRAIDHKDNWYLDDDGRAEKLAVVLADLAKEPVIVESGVVFIRGSD